MKGKILIGLLLMFLIIGTACAVEYTSLKNPKDFKAFDTFGVSEKETDGRVQLTVVPINDDAVKYMKAHPMSQLGPKTHEMEGVVCRPAIELNDRCHNRVIVKIKWNDFKDLV